MNDTVAVKNEELFAVLDTEIEKFGCTFCGYRSGYTPMSGQGCAVWMCGDCGKTSYVISKASSLQETSFSLGKDETRPKLKRHPRYGIPSHGQEDKRPEGSGEYFRSRGIGTDVTPGCFICGGEKKYYSNICAFVQCKEAGERVVAMFDKGARLDYREYEPDRVQVKIGACKKHLKNLEQLDEKIAAKKGIITQEIVNEAKGRSFVKMLFCGNEQATEQEKELQNLLNLGIRNLSFIQQPPHSESEEEAKLAKEENAECENRIKIIAEDIYCALTGKEVKEK